MIIGFFEAYGQWPFFLVRKITYEDKAYYGSSPPCSRDLSVVLQCVAVCCVLLRCVALCCVVLRCIALCCVVLQCVVLCCVVLQCDAVCCVV